MPWEDSIKAVCDLTGRVEFDGCKDPGESLQGIEHRANGLLGHIARSGTAVTREGPCVDRHEDDLRDVRGAARDAERLASRDRERQGFDETERGKTAAARA